ncbi:2-amino-4-hydroxy-6-hydroxymethyldihydropteridine diphosphokinase [Pseudomonas japonica]|uniref:2-amino-4-hydroxy-6-hydroxymethyldihydropteridine diphosphokinase n=1 Tax=Pseudomonas japonica TaxID=256466 RepID=A0A239JJB3_9PSED|nr:2-amino-4-hydroxy-6-hydroxymethyldihydropteridine diphosphokinase [Pseudomonas japonica]SNT05910.1 2-amino-4-hydroxy-6-hydroxymethyldihydropteridinediphosphokinase [Pseudomonas japonica]
MTDHRIFLGVGSNVQRETHIDIALDMLGEHLRDLRCSPVYESESLDGAHPPFFNLVVSATTDLSARALIGWLKEIEELHGRRRGAQSLITLDIDLLLFDDFAGLVDGVRVPRGEILTRAFVLYPLQLLAPQLRHPEFGLSMAELWKQLKPGPVLAPVRFPFGCEGLIAGKPAPTGFAVHTVLVGAGLPAIGIGIYTSLTACRETA